MPFMASAIKKAPKSRRSSEASRNAAAMLKTTADASAGTMTHHSPSVLRYPFFLCSASANAAMGRKAITFVACATCWLTPRNMVRTGISTVPPPMPIPPRRPASTPATRYIMNAMSAYYHPYACGEH